MARGKHSGRRLGTVAIVAAVVGVLVLVAGGVAFAGYRYEASKADHILPGVTVAGVNVGGMTEAEAAATLRREVSARLDTPLAITAGAHTWNVSPRSLGQQADVQAAVQQALSASDDLGFWSRMWHRLRGEPVDVSLDLKYSHGGSAVGGLAQQIARQVHRDPVNAALTLGQDGDVVFQHSKPGRDVDLPATKSAVRMALLQGRSTIDVPVKKVLPKVTNSDLGATLVVSIESNQLYLYEGFKVVRSYPVATAAAGYVTPRGQWTIINKAENPNWYNPAPDTWGADMPLMIPGGPGNPLGTRALYLNAPGVRIHGTESVDSIGTYASHGCIRMLMPDVEALYPLVPIGTTVLVV